MSEHDNQPPGAPPTQPTAAEYLSNLDKVHKTVQPRSIDNSGPAFPNFALTKDAPAGMTLRDFFAALAMQALIITGRETPENIIGQYAYTQAAAMLEQRTKK